MAQHDFNIDNQSAPAFRGDLNNALEALVTLSSGATAPATTYANMLWYDTANNILKMRSEADDAWIDLGTLDQSANTFTPAGFTNLSQVQVEDDTSTVFGQVSGQRLGQAIAALGSIPNTAGAIGTYVLGTTVNSDTARPQYVLGSTYAGSGLYPAGLASSQADNNLGNIRWDSTIDIAMKDNNVAALSGTWRAMGQTPNGAYDEMPVTLFVRIS